MTNRELTAHGLTALCTNKGATCPAAFMQIGCPLKVRLCRDVTPEEWLNNCDYVTASLPERNRELEAKVADLEREL